MSVTLDRREKEGGGGQVGNRGDLTKRLSRERVSTHSTAGSARVRMDALTRAADDLGISPDDTLAKLIDMVSSSKVSAV